PGEGYLIVCPLAADENCDLVLRGPLERPIIARCDMLDKFQRIIARLFAEVDERHCRFHLPLGRLRDRLAGPDFPLHAVPAADRSGRITRSNYKRLIPRE